MIGADAVVNGYTLNLTMEGTCTAPNSTDCAVTSNSSTGEIINPVQSARLITKNKVSIRYGKVEVIAKMPKGWVKSNETSAELPVIGYGLPSG